MQHPVFYLPSVVEMKTAVKHSTRTVFSSIPIACSVVVYTASMHSRLSSYLCRCTASLYTLIMLSLACVIAFYHTLLCRLLSFIFECFHEQYSLLCCANMLACYSAIPLFLLGWLRGYKSTNFIVHFCFVGNHLCVPLCLAACSMLENTTHLHMMYMYIGY